MTRADGLGARLRAERQDRMWTVRQLAENFRSVAQQRDIPRIDMLLAYIRRWERGRCGVSEQYRILYCQAFGVSEAYLFGTPDPPLWKITSPTTGTGGSASERVAQGKVDLVVLVLGAVPTRLTIEISVSAAGVEVAADSIQLPGPVSSPKLSLVTVEQGAAERPRSAGKKDGDDTAGRCERPAPQALGTVVRHGRRRAGQ